MSKYDVFKTKKGTELPLMNLKGKPYMQVAHRLVWFTEEEDNFSISTSFPILTSEETVAHVVITLLNDKGAVVKSATATKREDKKSFADHTEKAETGAIGRALALLGYGTQFAIADMDEGDRLADSPVAVVASKQASVLAGKTETVAQGVTPKATLAAVTKPAPFKRTRPESSGSEDIL